MTRRRQHVFHWRGMVCIILLLTTLPTWAEPVRQVPRQTLDPTELELEEELKTALTAAKASETADVLRDNPRAYLTRLSADLALPEPPAHWQDATSAFPGLADTAPWLRTALSGDAKLSVSPLFHALYEAKARWLQERSVVFHDLPDAAHFYDLDALWQIQPDMATGESGVLIFLGRFRQRPGTRGYDKLAAQEDPALDYRPTTTWRRPREGDPPPDLVNASKDLLKLLEEEYAIRGLPRKRNRQLEAGLARRREELQLFEQWQYLDSRETPFLVLPAIYRQFQNRTLAPEIGDPVLVIAQGRAVPAVFGDETVEPHAGELSPLIWEKLGLPEDQRTVQAVLIVFPSRNGPPEGPPPGIETIRKNVLKGSRQLGAPEDLFATSEPEEEQPTEFVTENSSSTTEVFSPAEP